MIVKCDRCQTRFKIPDEKVSDKGVKVRCTRCQNTFRVTRDVQPPSTPPVPPPAPAPEPDPFSQFGPPPPLSFGDSTRPGPYGEATRPVPMGPDGLGLDAPDERTRPVDMRATGLPALAVPPPAPTFAAQLDVPDEVFEQPTKVAAPAPSIPPVAPMQAPVAWSPPAPQPIQAPAVWSPPPPAPAPAEPESNLLGDLPPPDEDFFGAPGSPAGSGPEEPTQWGAPGFGGSERAALFDLPSQPSAPVAPPSEPEPPTVAERRHPPPPALAPAASPAAALPTPPEARRSRGLGAVIVNLVLAAALLLGVATVAWVYLNEGKLNPSELSLERVKARLTRPRTLVARDVSNGLYETRAGKPVFYVRGEVENRTDRAGRVRVRAEILDGNKLVRAAESLAGATASPEDLYGIASADDIDGLHQRLGEKAAAIQPGGRSPFLVAFYEYPPNLQRFRVRVVVERADTKETAAR